jgi:membrane associated rhomboid family serine protease
MSQYYRPSTFPPVIKNLIIINALVYLAQATLGERYPFITNYFALHDIHSVFFKPHQVISYMFMHGSVEHLLFNMLALWMFGSLLENSWGSRRFLFFYVVCGVGAALLHLAVLYNEMAPVWDYIHSFPQSEQNKYIYEPGILVDGQAINASTVGASGAIFGCLAAFGYLFPNSLIYVYFLIPIKAKWFVIIYGAIELWMGIRNSAGDNVAHFAHLGGAVVGLIIVYIWNKSNRKTLY